MSRKPSQHEIREFYNRVSRIYRLVEAFELGLRKRALELLSLKRKDVVLEVGCGAGSALLSASQSAGFACGIDVSQGMVAQAKRTMSRRADCKADLILADARSLPFRGNSFTAIFMLSVLDLLPVEDIKTVLSETKRVLKRENGRVLVASMTLDLEKHAIVRAYVWLHKKAPKLFNCRPVPVDELVLNAGFKIMHREVVKIAKVFPTTIILAEGTTA